MPLQQILKKPDGGFRLIFPQSKRTLQLRQDISAAEFQFFTAATGAQCIGIVGHDGTFFVVQKSIEPWISWAPSFLTRRILNHFVVCFRNRRQRKHHAQQETRKSPDTDVWNSERGMLTEILCPGSLVRIIHRSPGSPDFPAFWADRPSLGSAWLCEASLCQRLRQILQRCGFACRCGWNAICMRRFTIVIATRYDSA